MVHRNWRSTRAVWLLSVCALLLASCTTSRGGSAADGIAATPDDDSTAGATATAAAAGDENIAELRIATSNLAGQHFEPLTVTEFYKLHHAFVYDYVVGSDPDGTLNPERGLAESWERHEDGMGWSFTIRQGATFHNGDPVTGADLVAQLERLLDPDVGAGSHATFAGLIDSVELTDDHVVDVRTQTTDITLPYLLSNHGLLDGMLIPADYFESLGETDEERVQAFLAAPVGSGPYQVVDNQPGSHVLLEAYPDYWGGTPIYPAVRLQEVTEGATRLGALEAGEVHVIEASRADSPSLEAGGFDIHEKPSASTVGLVMHEQWVDDNPLSDPTVREAINHAIDREALLEEIFLGKGTLVSSWRAGSLALGYEDAPPPPYDPELAEQLLEEAGASGASITLLGFERQGIPEARDMMEAVAGMLQNVGLDAQLEWTDQGVVFDTWFSWPDHPSESPMMERWGPSISLNNTGNQAFPHQTARFIYYPEGLAKATTHDELTDIIDRWSAASTPEEYASITPEFQRFVRDEYIELPFFEISDVLASSPAVDTADWEQDVYQFSWNVTGLVVE